ncbi:MAG: hypothetical protein C0403_11715, partial [Desulfobacterium sp.]|nr:hypothetical protein [Desulfobacterium sp.]
MMSQQLPELSKEQWAFLAVLGAFGGPVQIEVVGTIVPLLPGPLFDLFGKAEPQGWIRKVEDDRLVIGQDLPSAVQKKMDSVNTRKYLSWIVDKIVSERMRIKIGSLEWLYLLEKAGRSREAAEAEIALAHDASNEGRQNEAQNFLNKAVTRLMTLCDEAEVRPLFLSATLNLSNISFAVGYGFKNIEKFLLKAQEVAEGLGDRRAHALLSLHIGRLYYFTDRRDDALVALSLGLEEIEELGDDDILLQSALFLGLFYFIKGHFIEAVKHFEKAEQFFET